MKTWQRVTTAVCAAAATALLCQQGAWAQQFMQFEGGPPAEGTIAPAQRLDQVPGLPGLPSLTMSRADGTVVHVMPTAQIAAQRAKAMAALGGLSAGQLIYHAGGSVMQPYAAVYVIYWAPSQLQNGDTNTGFSPKYGVVNTLLGAWYAGKGLGANDTQYFQTISNTTTYYQNNGGLGGFFIDTQAYPASGCTDPAPRNPLFPTHAVGTNCINDAQLQAEVQRAISVNHWPNGGLNNIFMVFTSSGENSCFDNGATGQCAYSAYCAYHGFIPNSGSPIIYSNEPFGDPSTCSLTTNFPNESFSDIASNPASHEMTEAMTDPLLNAWFDASGNEIGDLCNFVFGPLTWDPIGPSNANVANQNWNGTFFLLQQEFDNHTGACVDAGP